LIQTHRLRTAAVLSVLLASAACGESPAKRPKAEADRLWSYLTTQTAFGPRVAGMPGHGREVQWLRKHLELRAGQGNVAELRTPFTTTWGAKTELVDVFARFNPDSSRRVLLVAQWDTPPRTDSAGPTGRSHFVPGANDNASGVAVLMELAEIFRQQPPPVGVDLLLVDGTGPLGARGKSFLGNQNFTRLLPQGYRPQWAAVVRMVGDKELEIPLEAHSQRAAGEVAGRIWEVAKQMSYPHVFLNVPGDTLDDAQVVLQNAGIPAVEVADFSYGPGNSRWNTPQDLPKNLDRESLRVVSEVLAETIYREGRR
jgi:hypothetical protein